MLLDTNKMILVSVGETRKSLGCLVKRYNKGRQKNVDETGLWETIIRAEAHSLAILMDCSYVIAFSCQNDSMSKCHYKALDVTVNQRIIPSVGIFKELGCKVTLL